MKKALIIGAGPAGISASLYLIRSNTAEVTVITNGTSSLEKAELIENYFGFAQPISGKQLLQNARAGAERLGVKFIDDELTGLSFTDDMRFEAETVKSKDIYDAVLIATGSARKSPSIKGLSEFEGKGVSYCAVCDAFFYMKKDVAVIGNGEYASHEASILLRTASNVTLLSDGKGLSAKLPDGVKHNDIKIRSITGSQRVERVEFEDGSSLDVNGIFVAAGTAGSTEIARKIGVATDDKKIIVDDNFATNVPGIFAAGDCIGGLLQVSKAVGDGAVAGINMIKFLKK